MGNDRSEEELLAVIAAIMQKIETEDPGALQRISEKEKLFDKLAPITQAREKAILCLKILANAGNLPKKESQAAIRKCLDLHAQEVMLETCLKVLRICKHNQKVSPIGILLLFGEELEKTHMRTSVEMAEIIESLEWKKS
jgi:hypothetical protein